MVSIKKKDNDNTKWPLVLLSFPCHNMKRIIFISDTSYAIPEFQIGIVVPS